MLIVFSFIIIRLYLLSKKLNGLKSAEPLNNEFEDKILAMHHPSSPPISPIDIPRDYKSNNL